jgi:hypothetical protein
MFVSEENQEVAAAFFLIVVKDAAADATDAPQP